MLHHHVSSDDDDDHLWQLWQATFFGVPNGWLYTGPQGHKPGTRGSAICQRLVTLYLDIWIFFSILCAPPANQEKRRGKRCRLISWFPEWKVGWPNMNFITVISSNFDKRSRNLAKKQVTPKKINEHRWACICVHSECSVSRELKTARSARLATESYIYLSITLIAHCT